MTVATAANILNEDQALSLVEKVIKKSTAEGVFVSLSMGESSLSRYSENQITQNISNSEFNLTVTSYFGKRSASASTTEFDEDAIAQTIQLSEELAKIAPEDPEWVPLLEPQIYEQRTPAFDLATASFSPLARGEIIQKVCQKSIKAGINGSGILSTDAFLSAIGNSQGLRASNRGTAANFSFTGKIEDGSSWCDRTSFAINELPIELLTEQIIDRAFASRHPREINPGKYPVILDAPAVSDLLMMAIWSLDARAADEGRSFMSRIDANGKPIGNRLGEAMFSPLVQINRDPAHPLLQFGTSFSDGLSNNYLELIKDGIPQVLSYSRYWAQQQGKAPTGYFYPIVMQGTEQSLHDLIAQTERGILVSRTWYVNFANPKTLEVTGMTRDGTFWIEEGKIAYPIKNFRFNQNLSEMLRDVDALSAVERSGYTVVPGIKVKQFNFSSISDSV
ncbi:TldD/PmbA family protein [Aerosakkonemataceae cyanobacterium BLCC-F50]|uniref:TldD/PmbA family protein n=1 Tax=Floridaenema flaviceps BLCC-F50 TaxID=3153642 RepID=A0ABV4XQ67_9CYAN